MRYGKDIRTLHLRRSDLRLEDENGATPDFRLRADLVYNDDLPLMLGFLDVLERGLLHVHASANDSFLEFG